ncbi:chromosome partitioning protein [Micromonospora rosaria]|uniref:chromosome partitioning protein n=1 Tax=Micromonospora rosaria TaxID=47874 RepID=UPI0037CC16A7
MRAAEQGPARGGEQGTGAGGRAQPESPWAQPPQRPGTAAGDARGEAAATGPVRDGSALQPSPPQPPSHQQAASGQQSTADPQQPADAQAVPTVPQEPQAGRHRPVIPQQPVAPPQAGAEPVAAHPAHQQPAHQHPDQQHAAHQHPGQQHPAHQHPGQQHAAQQRPAQHPPYGPGPEQQPPGPVPQQPSPGPWAAQSGGGWAGPAPSSAGGWAGAVPPQPQPGPVPPATKAGGVEAGGVEAGATAAGVAGAGGRRPGPLPPTFNPPGPVPAVPPPGPVPPVPGPATAAAPSGPVSPVPPGPVPQQGGGWYPPPWQPGVGQPGMPVGQPGMPPVPGQQAYPEPAWTPETGAPPTAEDFARRRQIRPPDPVATVGFRAVINKTGLVKLPPGRHEQELRRDIEMVRRNFGGLRQVTVVNPKGGAGKTVAILLLAMTFGQKRGGYVLAWDNNETQGTLGMRAQQDFHSRTVRDMLRDLGQFQGAHGRVGDLSQYVRSQGEGMFDVLASDESATGGEMLTASAFAELREVVSRFYKLIFVDTGNNVRAQNWQAAMDATDQLVVTMSARNDSAETAARMLDHLEQSGRQRLVRQAVTVVSMPPSRKEIDLPAIQQHFAARTRAVLLAPYERLIDSGEPIRYSGLSSATRDAWLKIAASVAEGL